jgi:deoxyribonuclease-4
VFSEWHTMSDPVIKIRIKRQNPMRVRRILDSMSKPRRDQLKKLLPKGVFTDKTMKSWSSVKYPTGLLGALPDGEGYGLLGHIAEEMLGLDATSINLDSLLTVARKWHPDMTEKEEAKVRKSVTTAPFIERLVATRRLLESSFQGSVQVEPEITVGAVQGHPDMTTANQVYEIKLTGMLKDNWGDFVFQTFAYAALLPAVTQVNIVLPLQEHIWTYDVSGWTNRAAFLAALDEQSRYYQTTVTANKAAADQICAANCIGCHILRKGSFANSIAHITDGRVPYQLFLSSNMSSRINIKEEDIAATRAHIDATKAKIFIHSPYIINLCATPGEADDYHVGCLAETTRIAAAMGCSGVVVHVGKSTDKEAAVAMANFRTNLSKALEAATPSCPILLETPAGQGTETLTDWTTFMDFVSSFDDERLRVCIDTCHVFACGHDPLAYIQKTLTERPSLLKLIHYNDSEAACGACVDRHAFMGLGRIGLDTMRVIAEVAAAAAIPALIE